MIKIGFAGTAKNTGKTSAALHVLRLCQARRLRVMLTSIGYDGEAVDNVTGLPKPRYWLEAGMLLATAERCLKAGTAGYRILAETGIRTVLGRVMVAEITTAGNVLLAGPNRSRDISWLCESVSAEGIDFVIVDGALNRLVPMLATDGLVLSTGAALNEEIQHVAAHAGALADLLHLPVRAETDDSGRILIRSGENVTRLPTGSLLSVDTAAQILSAQDRNITEISLPGACDPRAFARLLEMGGAALHGCQFSFGSPLHLIASGNPLDWKTLLMRMPEQNQRAAVQQAIPLRLVTVNPFFPRYLSSGRYEAAEVDARALIEAVRAQILRDPVVNIRAEPLPDLLTYFGIPNRRM